MKPYPLFWVILLCGTGLLLVGKELQEVASDLEAHKLSVEAREYPAVSMVNVVPLVRPMEEVPLVYTAAMSLLEFQIFPQYNQLKEEIMRYGLAHQYSQSAMDRAWMRYFDRTTILVTWADPEAPNVTERKAIQLYSLSHDLPKAIRRYLALYCVTAEFEETRFYEKILKTLLDLQLPVILAVGDKVYVAVGYIAYSESESYFIVADMALTERRTGSVLKGTLANIHKIKNLKFREEFRRKAQERLKKGQDHTLISMTGIFSETLLLHFIGLSVEDGEYFAAARMMFVYPLQIDEEELAGLFRFSLLPGFISTWF